MEINDFKNKVLPFKRNLFRLANRILNNSTEAEDAVQDVLIKLWQKRADLDEFKNIEALAMKATKNQCLDVKKSKRYKNHLQNVDIDDFDYLIESNLNPSKEFEINDTIAKVHQIVNDLTENQKSIFYLRDVDGYEYAEISEKLNININTIKVTLSRVRKKIREELIKINNYEENEY